MTAEDYVGLSLIGIMATLLCGGFALLALRGTLRHLGILMILCVVAWLAGMLGLSRNLHFKAFIAAFSLLFLIHMSALSGYAIATRRLSARTYSGMIEFTDISSKKCLAYLRALTIKANLIKVYTGAGTQHFLFPGHALGQVLQDAIQRGTAKLKIMAPESVKRSDLLLNRLKEDRVEFTTISTFPDVFAIDFGPSILVSRPGETSKKSGALLLDTSERNVGALASSVRHFLDNLDMLTSFAPRVEVFTRADDYHSVITRLEQDALKVDKLVKRISVVFKPPELVEHIAWQRYGFKSAMYDTYLRSQTERRRLFLEKLDGGRFQQREICSWNALLAHLTKPVHAGVDTILPSESLVTEIECVVSALRKYPQGYALAITTFPFVSRYEIIDNHSVILHEAIGAADFHRINSLLITEPQAIARFRQEYEFIWESVPLALKDNNLVANILESLVRKAKEGRLGLDEKLPV